MKTRIGLVTAMIWLGGCPTDNRADTITEPCTDMHGVTATPTEVTLDPWNQGTGTVKLTFGGVTHISRQRPAIEQGAAARGTALLDADIAEIEISCAAKRTDDKLTLKFLPDFQAENGRGCMMEIAVHCLGDGTDDGGVGDGGGTGGCPGTMANQRPAETKKSGAGTITSGDNSAPVQAAVANLTVSLTASTQGGKVGVNGTAAEAPTFEFVKGANGPEIKDRVKKNYVNGQSVSDKDELTDVKLADDTLSFLWSRTNHDGSQWTAGLSIPLPDGTVVWFDQLPIAGNTTTTSTIDGAFSGDVFAVSGTSNAEAGTLLEVELSDGQRKTVCVQDGGSWSTTFTGVTLNSSGKVVAIVIVGSHYLQAAQIAK